MASRKAAGIDMENSLVDRLPIVDNERKDLLRYWIAIMRRGFRNGHAAPEIHRTELSSSSAGPLGPH